MRRWAALLIGLVVWTWTDEAGTIWFVDEAKKVPARYAEEARKIELQDIRHYRAYTGPVVNETEDSDRQRRTGD